MKIDIISDLHGYRPKLEGGDLLIIAGDFHRHESWGEYLSFQRWLNQQPYGEIILVAGNHDTLCQESDVVNDLLYEHTYLQDSGTCFKGLKIWGSPWTKTFDGMNPLCKGFTVDTEKELAEKWALIPDDIDILITHSPSFGNFDWVYEPDGRIGPSVGSLTLWFKMLSMVPKLKVHVCGHIHEAAGQAVHENGIHLINASYVNQGYMPVNKPVRIELDAFTPYPGG